ncbi:hypothetical protein GQO11_13620 [Acinetobacter johnsonii]|jgi:hypothetical protein|uniref:hypothetical protein n=1 Tax=Acinetobacter johnsonii TaxID=40214 RepID=UPI0013258B15|nr:hypothetical protein [Acinetobacter johnsonii]MWC19676.1 hypothetical protein [Acinetobacter johnsonii]
MPKEEEYKPNQYCFQVGSLNVDQAEEGKKKRTFSGVAYSGEVITDHWYWDRIIFDLDSMQIKGRIPALLDHSTRQRAGAINSHSIDHQNGLTVSGDLMSNEFGTQVAQDSDDGFPWQMSVRIEPSAVEEIQAGASVTVNGKVHQGPITVFRGGRIREVSFCALGADDNTNAVAASHSPKQFNQPEDTDVTELEKAQAAQKQAEKERDDALADLKKFKADKREEDIKVLETALNKQFSAEEKTSYTNMDDTSFAFMSQQLTQFSAGSQPPAGQQQQQIPSHLTHLFSHQATGGQGGQGGNQGGGDKHKFTAGAQAFAEQKGK